jgi:histidinol-phosphate aminotransferase
MSWEENIRKVVPYTPGEQPKDADMIKLNTNENPYPPSPMVEKALKEMNFDAMRLYPDPKASDLVHALADYYHVKPEQVFVGVGSDDVIAMSFMTYFNSDQPVLFPDITYSFYEVWADVFRVPYETIPLDESFGIRTEDYMRKNGGIIFPNPNAPTGKALELDQIERIVRANPDVVVIVDEAYVDFGAESATGLIEKYENLLVVQTFSKSRSMAGVRIGFAFGSEKLIGCLQDVKYSFNSYTMNRPSIVSGAAALQDEHYFQTCVHKIIETREWAKGEFRQLGFHFADSSANFIFVEHESIPAKKIFEALRRHHIYVRYFDKPRIDNYLRVTIGTREEMKSLFEFLKTYLG